jgi:hypothetical protein
MTGVRCDLHEVSALGKQATNMDAWHVISTTAIRRIDDGKLESLPCYIVDIRNRGEYKIELEAENQKCGINRFSHQCHQTLN